MSNYPQNETELAALMGKVICFNNEVEKNEIDFDAGMKARVIGFRVVDNDVFQLKVSFTEFEEVNKSLMLRNYYDNNHNPTLKWCETRSYPRNGETSDYYSWGGSGYEGSDCFDVEA